MDARKALLFIGLILCWTNQAHSQFQCACNDTQQCSPTGQLQLAALVQGAPGPKGSKGDAGDPGRTGAPGPYGPKGETVLTEDQFQTLQQVLLKNISANLSEVAASVMDIQRAFTKCDIYSTSWRRVAHIDMNAATHCPKALRMATNSTTKQRACGRRKDRGCSSLMYHIEGNYTHVCGRVRGYQFGETEAFSGTNINSSYADGVLITHGSPRRHLWTYTAGAFETHNHSCPCFPLTSSDMPPPPNFVETDYYCESGFVSNHEDRIAWENPLWDGAGCGTPGNTCCQRHGWFHKQVQQTSDSIEVRWCGDKSRSNEDVYTDILEIWVQ